MKINSTYKILVETGRRIFTYIGKIISNDDSFITFIDKKNKIISYNKNKIIYLEEISENDKK